MESAVTPGSSAMTADDVPTVAAKTRAATIAPR
jgi:hypothetical protein